MFTIARESSVKLTGVRGSSKASRGRCDLLRAVVSVFILFAFWIVLSGFFTPFLPQEGIHARS